MTLIIIILILILLLIYIKNKKEHYSPEEVLQNLSTLYNSQNNMTISNLNVTRNAIISNITTNDISANSLNIRNNFKVDSSGNINANNVNLKDISANKININNNFTIDASGNIKSVDNNNNSIGMRYFIHWSKGEVPIDKITDPSGNNYHSNNWICMMGYDIHEYNVGLNKLFVNDTDNFWYYKRYTIGHTGERDVPILCIPKKFFDMVWVDKHPSVQLSPTSNEYSGTRGTLI